MRGVRLAELCAATSLFTDVGMGQPSEHALRACLVTMRLADELDVDLQVRRDAYYVSMLRFLGCTSDAHQVAGMAGGDDRGFLAGMAPVTMGSARQELARLVAVVASGEALPRRVRSLARALADPGSKERLLGAHCEVASRLADGMGLPASVSEALMMAYARWDGRGVPAGVAGEHIPVGMLLAVVARDVELWARDAGPEATERMLRQRRGRAYAPHVVDAALAAGVPQLRRFADGDVWDLVLAEEPAPVLLVDEVGVGQVLAALGTFGDLKAPDFAGRSGRTARLAAAAGAACGLSGEENELLRRAGWVHDLGVVAVPAGIWTAPRALTVIEWESVRLHPMWTERLLARSTNLRAVATLAGGHHERCDRSGYPRGIPAPPQGSTTGLLACADVFDALTSPRAYRPAMDRAAAARELARMRSAGSLASRDVDAVLSIEGLSRSRPALHPAGLTEREVEVLGLLARGRTNRQIADALVISPKTVGAHVEHIYLKAGVSSRAAAAVFAMQHNLLG